MDNLTHTLVGAVTAQGFLKKKVGPEAVPILCWASNLPDIDGIVMLGSDLGKITLRRTFGHTIFLLPIWCAALAWVFKTLYPKQSYATLYGLCLLGALLHVGFDLVNSFGVVVLWPFSLYRPELACVFIIDLILTGLLLAPFLATRWTPLRAELSRACRWSAALVVAYLFFCGGARLRARALLQAQAAGLNADFSYVFPEPLGPHRWRGVLRVGAEYRLYLINAVTGSLRPAGLVRTDESTDSVRKVRASSPLAMRLDAFFKAPVWTVGPHPEGGVEAAVYDLRFRTLVLPRGRPFSFRFRVLPDGRVEERNRS